MASKCKKSSAQLNIGTKEWKEAKEREELEEALRVKSKLEGEVEKIRGSASAPQRRPIFM